MPYEIKSARNNETVKVIISYGSDEKHVSLRGPQIAYSAVLTKDMRSQAALGYITCKQMNELPKGMKFGLVTETVTKVKDVDVTKPDLGQSVVLAAVDQSHAAMTGEANPPPSTSTQLLHTEEELDKMHKEDVQVVAAALGIDTDQKKEKLIKAILKAQKKASE